MPNKNGGNGDSKGNHLTDEQLKMLATIILQHDERIEQIWDAIIEIKILLIESGSWPRVDEKELRDARRGRANAAGLVEMQRQRLRRELGLD
jgi:hypothetical protein